MSISDKQNETVSAFLAPHLQPEESLLAVTCLMTTNGVSPYWLLAALFAGSVFLPEPFAVAVTSQRVVIVLLTGKSRGFGYLPIGIKTSYLRNQVGVQRFSKGRIFGRLTLSVKGGQALDYRISPIYRDSAEAVANAIGRPVQ